MKNQYVNPYQNNDNERELFNDLFHELIRTWGLEIYFCPRSAGAVDSILGEDPLSYYPKAVKMMAFPENVDYWGGSGELIFNGFGQVYHQQMKLHISTLEWEENRKDYLMLDTGEMLRLCQSEFYEHGEGINLSDDDTTYDLGVRPLEEDLIYSPTLDRFLIVRHVQDDKVFYPMGGLYVFSLLTTTWDYSSQRVTTGIPAIDAVSNSHSTDVIPGAIVDEANGVLTDEANNLILDETGTRDNPEPDSGNEIVEVANDRIVFDERDPRQNRRKY